MLVHNDFCRIPLLHHGIYITYINSIRTFPHKWLLGPRNEQTQNNSEELYFVLLVTLALKTLLSISQNGISSITLNKQLGNHLNKCFNVSFLFSFWWMFPSLLPLFLRPNHLWYIEILPDPPGRGILVLGRLWLFPFGALTFSAALALFRVFIVFFSWVLDLLA